MAFGWSCSMDSCTARRCVSRPYTHGSLLECSRFAQGLSGGQRWSPCVGNADGPLLPQTARPVSDFLVRHRAPSADSARRTVHNRPDDRVTVLHAISYELSPSWCKCVCRPCSCDSGAFVVFTTEQPAQARSAYVTCTLAILTVRKTSHSRRSLPNCR